MFNFHIFNAFKASNWQRRVINLGAQDQDQDQAQVQGQDPVQVHTHDQQLDQEHNQDQNRRLLNEDDLYEPYASFDFTARLPYFSFPKLWNPLPIDCKTYLSLKIMCKKLKCTLKIILTFPSATGSFIRYAG
jgi:hypothetical protein